MADVNETTYQIKENIVTLSSDEEYTITGSCSECGIEVKKSNSVNIILNSISIDNSATGTFVIKKGSNVN